MSRRIVQYVTIKVVLEVTDNRSDEDAIDEFQSNVDYNFKMNPGPITVVETEFMETSSKF
jgi:hypothetical protein